MSFFDRLQEFLENSKEKWLQFLSNHKLTRYLLKRYLLTQRKHPNHIANRKRSAILVMFFLSFLALLIVGRLLYVGIVQKVDNVSLSEKTRQLYQGKKQIIAKRGTIYDRNGVVIAKDSIRYKVYAVLDKEYVGIDGEKLYVDSDKFSDVARILKKYLNIKESYTLKQLDKKVKQIEFGTKGSGFTLETRNKMQKDLKKAGIKGIYFSEQQDRIYPNGIFASHLIGYAQPENIKGSNEQKLVGVMGIEAAYNSQLSGVDGEEIFQQDGTGLPLPGTDVVNKKAKNGEDIYTTLDANLQVYLESLMTKISEEYNPELLEVVVMKAKTGEILATSQRPTFNPETKEGLQEDKKDKKDKKKKDDGAKWRNLLVQDVYEPGSVMKVFTVAAAIQSGVFNANEYYQAGSINVDGQTINDWDYYAPKVMNFAQALYHSSNVGMILLEQKMDSNWPDYMKRFGFLKSTNSGLPGELVGTANFKTSVDRAMTSFGQAVSVTPMQILQASTTIANGGAMLKPQYILKTYNPNDKKTKPTKREIISQPISGTTAQQVLDILSNNTEDKVLGTASDYKLKDYYSATKTGTAQIFENGHYSNVEGDFLYSVLQYAPYQDPEYIVYAFVKRPKQVTEGSYVLAQITTPLMERVLELDANSKQYKRNAVQDK